MHNFIFIRNSKNPINEKIYIFPLNNIYIYIYTHTQDNFKNLINQVPT